MAISSLGAGSGILTSDLLDKLVEAEKAPVELRLDREQEQVEAQISEFGNVKSSLNSLSSAVSALSSSVTFDSKTSTSTNDAAVTATASSIATPGLYTVETSQLAQAHSLASVAKANITDTFGTGTLTFAFGTTGTDAVPYDPTNAATHAATYSFTADPERASKQVTITDGTMAGIRDAVNAADIGVQASIVNDGSGYRLLFSSTDTGENNSLQITTSAPVDGGGLDQLRFDGNSLQMTQTMAAQDAELTVNGLSITRETNLVTGVVNGLTLNLKQTNVGSPATISVAADTDKMVEKVQAFVDSFNEFKTLYNSLTAYDPETQVAGLLLGDSSLRTLNTKIRSEIGDMVEGLEASTLRTLGDVGISSDKKTGLLSLDSSKLTSALSANPDDLTALFATDGRTTDSLVDFNFASSATKAGVYAVNISQLATQSTYEGNALPTDYSTLPATIDATNDTFKIKVNGTTSGTISLTQATYTPGSALAQELQSQINSDSALLAAGASVTVDYDAGNNRFVFTSNRYGSASQISFTEVESAAVTDLGLVVGAGVANVVTGLDVAGTINGKTATGTGQALMAAAGDDSEGISLMITGGAIGDRGTVTFIRGVASSLDGLLDQFLASDGLLANKTDLLNDQLAENSAERAALDERMASLRSRLENSFTYNDILVSQLNTTQDYLKSQLSILEAMFKPSS